jgi:hypothetical protein
VLQDVIWLHAPCVEQPLLRFVCASLRLAILAREPPHHQGLADSPAELASHSCCSSAVSLFYMYYQFVSERRLEETRLDIVYVFPFCFERESDKSVARYGIKSGIIVMAVRSDFCPFTPPPLCATGMDFVWPVRRPQTRAGAPKEATPRKGGTLSFRSEACPRMLREARFFGRSRCKISMLSNAAVVRRKVSKVRVATDRGKHDGKASVVRPALQQHLS